MFTLTMLNDHRMDNKQLFNNECTQYSMAPDCICCNKLSTAGLRNGLSEQDFRSMSPNEMKVRSIPMFFTLSGFTVQVPDPRSLQKLRSIFTRMYLTPDLFYKISRIRMYVPDSRSVLQFSVYVPDVEQI